MSVFADHGGALAPGRRLVGRFVALAALVLMSLVALPGTAAAHNVLVSSDPADGATLDAAPKQVTFTFDQAIETYEPVLRVFGPNGNVFSTAEPTVVGSEISAPMEAGAAGVYRAVYRIISADGHPVAGEISFTLTESAAGTAVGTVPDADEGAGSVDDGAGSGGRLWVIVLVVVAAVLVAAAVVIALRKPRSDGEGDARQSPPADQK